MRCEVKLNFTVLLYIYLCLIYYLLVPYLLVPYLLVLSFNQVDTVLPRMFS